MQKKILFLNIILNVFIIFSFRIKLYNTFLLHDINNNRINNQIMNNETLVNVSYYTSLVLCSIVIFYASLRLSLMKIMIAYSDNRIINNN